MESGARTLGAESIRSRAESTEGCVKTEDSQRDTADLIHLLQRVYRVPNSLLDWEPVERLKQRSDAVSFTVCQYEASSTVLCATKAI